MILPDLVYLLSLQEHSKGGHNCDLPDSVYLLDGALSGEQTELTIYPRASSSAAAVVPTPVTHTTRLQHSPNPLYPYDPSPALYPQGSHPAPALPIGPALALPDAGALRATLQPRIPPAESVVWDGVRDGRNRGQCNGRDEGKWAVGGSTLHLCLRQWLT